ncbi:hypothetical protein JIN84_11845 [Luteolibacter yonseiensis]|uniref:Uncharacterized protein n=1 Tax=Luteolibacter yonseiensis TaxID=1144680 RepID=A0A934VAL0_9BACT|nr:hypothetical protein [Luteolibacter yonseiensis]MBK1816308.1 hypothetical protein [Luteolibacter yonseiensis]
MKIEELAALVIAACEVEQIDYMMTGAFAVTYYAIPRSTNDVDFVLSLSPEDGIDRVIRRLSSHVTFESQVQFDTLTWGRRHVGLSRSSSALKVELFELFDDAFVRQQFERRRPMDSKQLRHRVWLPTAEDVIVQKLRWGRNKDLDDARDVLAVQGPETLDMPYIRKWCELHKTSARLEDALAGIPPL